VVTICTTSLTFSNSRSCPHGVFLCFVWIWEKTAIISLYSINWLVLRITETENVYCAVRTDTLYVFHFNLDFLKVANGQVFLQIIQFFSVSTIPPLLQTHLHLHDFLTRRTNGRNLGTFEKQCSFVIRGALHTEVHFVAFKKLRKAAIDKNEAGEAVNFLVA